MIEISKIKNINTLVIKQTGDERHFIITSNSIIIPITMLATLLKSMLMHGFIKPQLLEGLLEEYNSTEF